MADPIPLSAPDGTVYAWACGECHDAWAQAWLAAECCDRCRCRAAGCEAYVARHARLCCEHERESISALHALAAIGMAVATQIASVECSGRYQEALAALCGVSPETARGWG